MSMELNIFKYHVDINAMTAARILTFHSHTSKVCDNILYIYETIGW